MDMMSLRRRVLVNQNKLTTATGNPITFNTPLIKPLKECVVRFTPQQEGQGTPSPKNIREIVGKSSITIYQQGDDGVTHETSVSFPAVGKNLCPDISTWESGYTNSSGDISPANSTRLEKYSDYIPVDELENYTFSYNADGITEQLWTCICAYDENKEYLTRHISNSNFVSRKLIAGTRFVRLSCRTYGMVTEAQFEKSAEPTAYEPFDNTVYGGYVDLVNGEVVAEYACVTLDGVNLKVKNGYSNANEDVFGAGWVYCDPTGKNSVPGKYCETLPIYARKAHEPPFIYVPAAGRLYCVIYCGKISEHPEITTTAERVAFTNAWLQEHPVTFVYDLKEPIHYSLTTQSIATLRGNNVMWSDANGDLTVKYWTR